MLPMHVQFFLPILQALRELGGSATPSELKDYPVNNPEYVFYGSDWLHYALFYAEGKENITIRGEGTIDGQGSRFVIKNNKKPYRYMNRPYIFWFIRSKHIRVEGIRLRNSAFWMQHYLACDDVTIRGIHVYNHSNKNNDMIDIDGCRNVHISGCTGDSDDDALTIKSTSGRISENITVTNCIFSSHCNAIKCGTESGGGFRNITISNCIVKPSVSPTKIYGAYKGDGGIALEVVDGGIMENVKIDNIVIDGPQVPIFIRLGNRARAYRKDQGPIPVGTLQGVTLSNITATASRTPDVPLPASWVMRSAISFWGTFRYICREDWRKKRSLQRCRKKRINIRKGQCSERCRPMGCT